MVEAHLVRLSTNVCLEMWLAGQLPIRCSSPIRALFLCAAFAAAHV